MNDRVSVKVYLTHETRSLLEAEAGSLGLSLSAYLRAFAKLLLVRADLKTPTAEIAARFRELLELERRRHAPK